MSRIVDIEIDARFHPIVKAMNTAIHSHNLAAPDLLSALRALAPPVPPPNARCHNGIVEQASCSHCQRIIRAHALIAQVEDIVHRVYPIEG